MQQTSYCMSVRAIRHNIGTHPRACGPRARCQYSTYSPCTHAITSTYITVRARSPGIYGNVNRPCPRTRSVYCHKSLALTIAEKIIATGKSEDRGFLNHVDPIGLQCLSDLEYSNGNYASASVFNKITYKSLK